jgi:hypothetical protein
MVFQLRVVSKIESIPEDKESDIIFHMEKDI